MPLYQSYVFTTANQYVKDFAAFAAANGWTLDFDGAYLTSYWRVHLHKGAAHFEIRSYSATGYYISSCTGYTPATTPALQPGYNGTEQSVANTVGHTYWFVSTAGALYFTRANNVKFEWGAFFIVSSKIGVWANGHGLTVPSYNAIFLDTAYANPTLCQLFYAGVWSPTVVAGGMAGSNNGDLSGLLYNQPSVHNAGLVPMPILLMLNYAADTSKRVPLGFAPDLYRTNGGNLYVIANELVIGADTYVIMPDSTNKVGGGASGDLLFKLGA